MSFIAKKSLGQNFLHAPHVAGMMIHAIGIKPGDIVLETGPGKGALTSGLIEAGAHVIAVEKDIRSVEFLQEKYATEIKDEKIKIISGDILEYDPEKEISGDYVIAANIPYYITGEFLRKFLESSHQPKKMILMLQKEVGKRIASDKKESILSISVKAYAKPRYIETIAARHFRPVPKVDSAVVLIDMISKDFFKENNLTESHFFTILKAGFAHKRKVLIKNLQTTAEKEILQKIWNKIGLSSTVRAESLTLSNWGQIASFIATPNLL
jgi:16S rRNA (adenine1518-N6/adenine1519-N6)-dimethyltransferase